MELPSLSARVLLISIDVVLCMSLCGVFLDTCSPTEHPNPSPIPHTSPQHSDAIMVYENDQLHRICVQLLAIPVPSLFDMNAVIARSMASVLLPATLQVG